MREVRTVSTSIYSHVALRSVILTIVRGAAITFLLLVVGCGGRTEVLAREAAVGACPAPFAMVGTFALAGDEVIAGIGRELVAFDKTSAVRRSVAVVDSHPREIAANPRWIAWSFDGGGLSRMRVDGTAAVELLSAWTGSWETPSPYGIAIDAADTVYYAMGLSRAGVGIYLLPLHGSSRRLDGNAPIVPLEGSVIAQEASYFPKSIVRLPKDGSLPVVLHEEELVDDPHAAQRRIAADERRVCFTTGRAGLRGEHSARYRPAVRCVSADAALPFFTSLGPDSLPAIALRDETLFVATSLLFPPAESLADAGELLVVRAFGRDRSERTLLRCLTPTHQKAPSIAVDERWVWVHTAAGALYRVAR